MKKLFSIFKLFTIALLGAMVLTACDRISNAGDSQSSTNDSIIGQEQADSAKNNDKTGTEKDSKQQSIKELSNRVNKITADIDSIRKVQKDLKAANAGINDAINTINDDIKKINGAVRTNQLYVLIAIVCAVLALISSIIAIIKAKGYKACLDRLRKETDITRKGISDLNKQANSNSKVAPATSINNSNDFSKLSQRIDLIEIELKSNKAETIHNVKNQPIVKSGPQERHTYFGTPSQAHGDSGYFKKELKSRDSETMFSAVITGTNAEFKPIDDNAATLGTLKSSEPMKLAVEFDGCAPAEANSMEVKSVGVAEFDRDRWYIKKKTKVHLKK
jgi:hypothetical protein